MTDDIERLARGCGAIVEVYDDDPEIGCAGYTEITIPDDITAFLERFYRAAYRAGMESRPIVRPKPIEWTHECGRGAPGFQEWIDNRYGFHIRLATEISATPYIAVWGEGDSEEFATLEGAQEWCRQQIEAWVRENTELVEPSAEAARENDEPEQL
ncbi:MAG: hypothetical protein HMLKMBBP_01533 [Planctomycetes bacterium]|nr:hypothetical protein [Planctomycetota bacterium]